MCRGNKNTFATTCLPTQLWSGWRIDPAMWCPGYGGAVESCRGLFLRNFGLGDWPIICNIIHITVTADFGFFLLHCMGCVFMTLLSTWWCIRTLQLGLELGWMKASNLIYRTAGHFGTPSQFPVRKRPGWFCDHNSKVAEWCWDFETDVFFPALGDWFKETVSKIWLGVERNKVAYLRHIVDG